MGTHLPTHLPAIVALTAQPRRIWNVLLPAELHSALSDRCGQRGLTAAVADAVEHLTEQEAAPTIERPARDRGTVEITIRLPVEIADGADQWRAKHGLTRQATIEYAVLAALEVAS